MSKSQESQGKKNTAEQAVDPTDLDPMNEWNQAVAEQNAHATAAESSSAQQVFKPLDNVAPKLNAGFDIDLLKDIPVQLSVELGRARITIRELLQLNQGSVVELANLAGEPMDIFINGYLIAQGEVVVVGDSYGVRLTDIVTPSERLSRLAHRR